MSRIARSCKFCGGEHVFDKNRCPAFKFKCNVCQRKGHFGKMCYKNKNKTPVKQLNDCDVDFISKSDSDDSQYECVEAFKTQFKNKGIYSNLLVKDGKENVVLKCQLDTAAGCNVIGEEQLKMFKQPLEILKTSTKL